MDFLKRLAPIFSRTSPEVLLPLEGAQHLSKVRQHQLDQIRQPDGCYLFDLDIRTCKDGSLLISTAHPVRFVIGLPKPQEKGFSDLICTAAETAFNLQQNSTSRAYIIDTSAQGVIHKKDEEKQINPSFKYKILLAPQGSLPDFDAALKVAAKVQPKPPTP